MRLRSITTTLVTGIFLSQPASALDIMLVNDDSYVTNNIQTLFTTLKGAGHNVIMSAPCLQQSGKAGAITAFAGVNVQSVGEDQVCIGDTDESTAKEDFVDGTPVMASLYGIDVFAQEKWGKNPDLVIAGPNEGNNLGYVTNVSGTLGATNAAISRGIPAIAISAHDHEDDPQAVADVVLEVVSELVANQTEGKPLMPRFTGLNINTPEELENNKGFTFTRVGWDAAGFDGKFVANMSEDPVSLQLAAAEIIKAGITDDFDQALQIAALSFEGKPGLTLDLTGQLYVDDNRLSEGNKLAEGYITISTIEANVQATLPKSAWTAFNLKDLVD